MDHGVLPGVKPPFQGTVQDAIRSLIMGWQSNLFHLSFPQLYIPIK